MLTHLAVMLTSAEPHQTLHSEFLLDQILCKRYTQKSRETTLSLMNLTKCKGINKYVYVRINIKEMSFEKIYIPSGFINMFNRCLRGS